MDVEVLSVLIGNDILFVSMIPQSGGSASTRF
jgi:hypothetical protein